MFEVRENCCVAYHGFYDKRVQDGGGGGGGGGGKGNANDLENDNCGEDNLVNDKEKLLRTREKTCP